MVGGGGESDADGAGACVLCPQPRELPDNV